MTTEEQIQPSDIQQTNGVDDDGTHEHEGEVTSSDTSTRSPRRSRFFRTKRKQRINEDQINHADDNSEVSNQPVDSSENPELPTEETSVKEISTTDTNKPIESVITKRSLSPPPPPPSSDDTDELDGNSLSEQNQFSSSSSEDMNIERKSSVTSKSTHEKSTFAQSRPSLPTIYSGYQRKKSQSVKLTRIDSIDPYQKKIVRFADDFGLDLSQVKVIKSDELPHVPSAAFKDLHINNDDTSTLPFQERMRTITYLEQKFENPLHAHGFEDRVLRHKVVLEQANAIDNRLYGTVKVISFGLNKRVKIRLTTDNWISYQDYDATYITDSFDGTHDRFTFTFDIDRDRICIGNNIQFCIGYESYVGPEYWDSNYQQNYRFDCVSRTIPDYSA